MGKVSSRSAAAWAESPPGSVHVRDAGAWKEAKAVHVRDGGVWKEVFKFFIGFIRPDSDIETTDWTSTPLWSKLDEVSPDDTTTEIDSEFFGNPAAPQVYDFEVSLSNPAITPTGAEVVTLKVRHWLEILSGGITSNDVTIELKQGSTVKATISTSGNTGTYVTSSKVLSQAEKDSITNWDDLRVRFEQSVQVTTLGDEAIAHATWIELQFS